MVTKKVRRPKRRKKKVKASVATTRSRAGPGFAFEDQIGAYLLLQMLMGEALPGTEDSIGSRLQTQTKELGWAIDDLLATSHPATETQRRAAVSCKSSIQVSANGLPKDFALAAWEQWCKRGKGRIKRGQDHLILATRGHHSVFISLWADIKNWSGDEPKIAIARIRGTAKHRKLFASIKTPIKKLRRGVRDEELIAFIRHLEVLQTDFDLANSRDRAQSIGRCRNLLEDATLIKGRELWEALIGAVRNARLGDGTVELEGVIQSLSGQFALKDHPSYVSSWLALETSTAAYKKNIESTLPNKFAIDRTTEITAVTESISQNAIFVLYGESGNGKSALIKAMLDQKFAGWRQVWLDPDQLTAALKESERAKLGLTHPLIAVLKASNKPDNVLIIDSAERLSREVQNSARDLVTSITRGAPEATSNKWRVIIVGQPEAWAEGAFATIAGMAVPPNREVQDVSTNHVRAALLSAPRLSWAASYDEIIAVLSNLRTLAWVFDAQSSFRTGDVQALVSYAAIADHIWRYWTNGKVQFQNLLIRLAEREANFEHSFEVSKLDLADAVAIDELPAQAPLRRNARNRIEFQHDLAAEWARFQRLKEIASQPERWASYAERPLWIGALRMLGGFLLRETVDGRSEWDVAFEKLESQKNILASDILLDAICLDPLAESFLLERADFLLKDHGRLLDRLLKRFQYIATAPGGGNEPLADAMNADPTFTLYIESQFRTPIFARWPAMARFLHAHRDQVASLVSTTVAALCQKWLTSLPVTFPSGEPIPFRKEFAELALATARTLQLEELKRDTIYAGDFGKSIYPAALAAAPDLPAEVSAWALEMARRRPLTADLKRKLDEHRQRKVREHQEKLRTDPEYRARIESRERFPPSLSSGRRLPPWPLGPKGKVDRDFSECCASGGALIPLMRVRPDVAAEVLLAALIEGAPEERYGSSRFDEGLGLQFDMQSYPTAYWKSPFFAFLQISPDAALDALLRLTSFCTERWIAEWKKLWSGTPPSISLILSDSTEHQFLGGSRVFAWSETNSSRAGQLHSALAALERYLTLKIGVDLNVEPELERLLLTATSAGLLGVLTNVGKYKPDLFRGVLRPLVTHNRIYQWDDERAVALQFGFPAPHWARQGDMIFNMARDWHQAPYRHKSMRVVVAELTQSDAEFAFFVNEATAKWRPPSDQKSALELRILAAQLDSRNYRRTPEGPHELVCPPELAREIEAFQNANLPARQILALPDWCSRVLSGDASLSDAQTEALSATLDAIDAEANLDEEFKTRARVAVASTLLTRGSTWLDAQAAARERSWAIVHAVLSAIPTTMEELRASRLERAGVLEFAAHAVLKQWVATGSVEAQSAIVKIVTSGDEVGVTVLYRLAHTHRLTLGEKWWRLLYLGLLWSALSMLMPRFGYQADEGARWIRWLNWLRNRRLDGVAATRAQIEPVEIAKRLERLEKVRWRREFARRDALRGPPPGQRRTAGLNWDFLEAAFAWLWWEGEKPNPLWDDEAAFQEQRHIILSLWDFEVWLNHRRFVDRNDHPVPHQLGFNIIQTIARMMAKTSGPAGQELWQPVLKLGASGHYSVGHFISCWFFETTRLGAAEFAARWQPMIEYALDTPEWGQGRPWYYGQSLLRQILGFGSQTFLDRNPAFQGVVRDMTHHYERWAREYLSREEDNVTGLCFFLASSTGRALRMKGLAWLQQAVTAKSWYRPAMGNALVEFLNVTLTQDAQELRSDAVSRDAYLALVALLVSKQVPAALALQERARRSFSNA
ncbi:MAG: ATP-binding protein [Hyphomicrobiales bacterium]|nr:ATP-binding protein [Hyphomicrobiales bacterium]MBV9429639.1 ATP-binding protein [Bradyrhizobiaceae bacterium]